MQLSQTFPSRATFAAAVKALPGQWKIGSSRVSGEANNFVRYVCLCSKKCRASVRAIPVASIEGEWVIATLKLDHTRAKEATVERSISPAFDNFTSSTEDFEYQPPAKRIKRSRSPSFAFELAYDTPATSIYNDGYASSDLSELSCEPEHFEQDEGGELPAVGTIFATREAMQQANLRPDEYQFTTIKSRTSKDVFQVDYGCSKGKKGRAGYTGCQCKITVHCVGSKKWVVVKGHWQHNHGSAHLSQPIIRVIPPQASTSQLPIGERISSPLSDLAASPSTEHYSTAATRVLPPHEWKPRSAQSLKTLHLIVKNGFANLRTTLDQQGREV